MRGCNLPYLSIIVPVHNQSGYTRSCLASLAKYPPHVPYDIFVVDDCSSDDTPRLLADEARKDGRIRSIRNDNNTGFAGACNRGAAAASGEYLLFLNNDTEVLPDWCPPLLSILENNPDIGIVGPKLCFPDRTVQHCGKIWKDTGTPLSQPHHIYFASPCNAPFVNKSREYMMITGACIMVRRNEFLSIGPFDELYENGWEDDDLCYAYYHEGKRVFYCSESTVIHHQSKTLNTDIREIELRIEEHRRQAGFSGDGSSIALPEMKAREKELVSNLERKLRRVRERFHHNRNRFFSKWRRLVERDDYRYYREDGLPFISIVLLTFNQRDKTQDCLESIRRHTPELHEIIIIDNGSTDSTIEWLREVSACCENITVIENGTNRGFAAGCNQGIEAARGEYVLLLNNDVVVTKDWLGGLLECLHAAPDIGIVGPMTNNISGIQQVPEAHYSSLEELDTYAAGFRHRNRHRRIPYRRIVGFCMLFRKALPDEIGLLDEGFGTGNFEDDDFCLRAELAGYRNVIAGDVFIHHVGSASFRGNNLDYISSLTDNGKYFREKWSRPVTNESDAKRIVALKTLEKAELLFQRGEHEKLIETILQEGIRVVPDEKRFYLALAGYFLDLERYKDALDTLSERPETCGDETGHILTGFALTGMGRHREALKQGNCALSLNPRSPRAFQLLGVIAEALGQETEARKCWEQAMSLDPGYGEPCSAIGALELKNGFKDTGLELLERGFLLSPLMTATALRYHTAVSEAGKEEQAVKHFLEMHRVYPNHRTVQFLLIDLLIRLGKIIEALEEVETACVTFGVTDDMLAAGLELRRLAGSMTITPEKKVAGQSISLCMIVKNEQENLPRCLKSLKPIADEIIIVDTGSSDRSREIAQLFGAHVLEYPWNGDFSAARNVSLEHASGDWILVMDADEVLSPLDYDNLRGIVNDRANKEKAFLLETRNYSTKVILENWRPNDGLYPVEEAGAGWVGSIKIRLFPNRPDIRFEGRIHELVHRSTERAGITVAATPIPVHHYGYLDQDKQKRKDDEYYLLGKEKLAENGYEDLNALSELAIQAGSTGRYEEAVKMWNRAISINNTDPLAYFNLGFILMQLGKFSESRDASAKAIELQPGHIDAVINYVICDICLDGAEKALGILADNLRVEPSHFYSRLMLAISQICVESKDEGLAGLNALRSEGIVLAEFLNDFAKKLMMTGKTLYSQRIVEAAILSNNFNDETLGLAQNQSA